MKIAAIDIGANSIHLVISRVFAPGVQETLDRSREMLRLGEHTFGKGHLPPAELDRAIEVLRRYRAIAEAHGVEAVLAVATSAVRDARNRGDFVKRAEAEARLAVRVLTGEEEGRLIYAGVREGLPASAGRIAVIDIGGGSAEVIVGDAERIPLVRSLKLGVLRLAQKFGRPKGRTLREGLRYIKGEIGPTAREVARLGVSRAYGTSGSILTLATLLGVRDELRPVELGSLADLSSRLTTLSAGALEKLSPVGKHRADTIGWGSLVLRTFLEEAGLKEITPCERALREGVVADYVRRNSDRLQIHDEEIADPRRKSVYYYARRLGALDLHARQTTRLSLNLFDSLLPLHRLGSRERELLEYASLLHDAGYWIGARSHHKHTAYLIREGPLEGFTDEERALIALIARYHRGSMPKRRHADFSRLSKRDQRRVAVLASMLRISDALDRSHGGLVKELHVGVNGGSVTLEVGSPGDLDLELFTAERRADLLQKVFGREVKFRVRKNGT